MMAIAHGTRSREGCGNAGEIPQPGEEKTGLTSRRLEVGVSALETWRRLEESLKEACPVALRSAVTFVSFSFILQSVKAVAWSVTCQEKKSKKGGETRIYSSRGV